MKSNVRELPTIDACRVCGGTHLQSFFDLGNQPFAEGYLAYQTDEEYVYPLSLSFCPECSLVQLNETADRADLFSHFWWVTGTSKVATDWADIFFQELTRRTMYPRTGYVLEVASNDGTFLKPFIASGYIVRGVDPAENIATMARKNRVPTITAFWSAEAADIVLRDNGHASMVFARNVVPHVSNLHSFVEGLARVLHPDGTLAIEVHYAGDILKGLHYDSIYHEHLCYFSLKQLERLLERYKLNVFDVIPSPINNGAIVVYARRGPVIESKTLKSYRRVEAGLHVNSFDSWKRFAERAAQHKHDLMVLLRKIHIDGDPIFGYGASARSSTLFNFCGIGSWLMPFIADKNTMKHGHYTPGSHMLIESPEAMMARGPAYIYIAAWNFAAEIMNYLTKKFNYKGKYVIPLPGEPRVVQG